MSYALKNSWGKAAHFGVAQHTELICYNTKFLILKTGSRLGIVIRLDQTQYIALLSALTGCDSLAYFFSPFLPGTLCFVLVETHLEL